MTREGWNKLEIWGGKELEDPPLLFQQFQITHPSEKKKEYIIYSFSYSPLASSMMGLFWQSHILYFKNILEYIKNITLSNHLIKGRSLIRNSTGSAIQQVLEVVQNVLSQVKLVGTLHM